MWRKGNALALLVGMQTSTATMENSVEIPLKTVNSAAINSVIHVSFSVLVSSRYMPRNGTAGSYGGFIPSF